MARTDVCMLCAYTFARHAGTFTDITIAMNALHMTRKRMVAGITTLKAMVLGMVTLMVTIGMRVITIMSIVITDRNQSLDDDIGVLGDQVDLFQCPEFRKKGGQSLNLRKRITKQDLLELVPPTVFHGHFEEEAIHFHQCVEEHAQIDEAEHVAYNIGRKTHDIHACTTLTRC